MSNTRSEEQGRDEILRRLLETPPQPRPKREREKKDGHRSRRPPVSDQDVENGRDAK